MYLLMCTSDLESTHNLITCMKQFAWETQMTEHREQQKPRYTELLSHTGLATFTGMHSRLHLTYTLQAQWAKRLQWTPSSSLSVSGNSFGFALRFPTQLFPFQLHIVLGRPTFLCPLIRFPRQCFCTVCPREKETWVQVQNSWTWYIGF